MDDALSKIRELLAKEVADLSGYDDKFLLRRIGKRMSLKNVASTEEYYDYLQRNEDEKRSLVFELAINVTHFLRDRTPFDTFRDIVVPKIKERKLIGDEILIWSAGCASGEEPYSIAMMLYEALGRFLPNYKIKIIATDVNESALARARAGMYEEQQFRELDEMMRAKYIIDLNDGRLDVKPHVRSLVEFRQHNLLEEKPPGLFDAIFCRNTVIYFGKEAKEKLFAQFRGALKENGYLIIGKTETLPQNVQAGFETVSIPDRIYKKI